MDSKTKRAVIFLIICILAVCVNHCICNKFKKQYIIVNNKKYETKEIDCITRDLPSDENTIIVITNDGDKIYVKTYTLKDKGE